VPLLEGEGAIDDLQGNARAFKIFTLPCRFLNGALAMTDRRPEVQPLAPEPDSLDGDTGTTSNKARQGITGHNVRYVLFFGIAGVVLGFVLVYLAVFG
jgi:hypothetical protein